MPANKPPCANRETLEAFARFFDPPLAVVATDKIGGVPVANGWTCALHLPEHEIGLTAVCWGKGYFKAWIEATGTREDAETVAAVMSSLMDDLGTAQEARTAMEGPGATTLPANELPPVQPAQKPATATIQQPNPEFVDMLGLDPAERLALCREYPDLRFAVDREGNRKRIGEDGEMADDPAAGYVASDRLEHVRRLNRGRTEGAKAVADAAIDRVCEHDFRKNSIGDQTTCWKCGLAGPKAPQLEPDADAEHAEYLRKVAAQQAAYDAEQVKQRLEGGNGGTQT